MFWLRMNFLISKNKSGWHMSTPVTYTRMLYMVLDARKPVFGGLRTIQEQTSLCMRADWSAPLLFAFWKVSYLNLLQAKFQFLASLCSWGDWFEISFVGNLRQPFLRQGPYVYSTQHKLYKVCTKISNVCSQYITPFTLCILSNFSCFCCHLLTFF